MDSQTIDPSVAVVPYSEFLKLKHQINKVCNMVDILGISLESFQYVSRKEALKLIGLSGTRLNAIQIAEEDYDDSMITKVAYRKRPGTGMQFSIPSIIAYLQNPKRKMSQSQAIAYVRNYFVSLKQ